MIRMAGAVVVLFCSLSPTEARYSYSAGDDRAENVRQLLAWDVAPKAEKNAPQKPEIELNDATVVVLDGKVCAYEDVPSTAVITKVALAADGRTITRIEFASRK
jgi:hypothetical protein